MGSFEPRVITRQQIELETCSNPLKMGKVLQFSRKKIVSVLDVVFFSMFAWWAYVYVYFVDIWMASSSLGSRPNKTISWIKVFLETRLWPSKDSYYSLVSKKTLSHEIGSLIRRWHHTKLWNIPQSWRHWAKTLNPKLKIFFSF